MSKKQIGYCIFWIPAQFYPFENKRKFKLKEKTIKDISRPNAGEAVITIEANSGKNSNFTIHYTRTDSPKNCCLLFDLEFVSYSKLGFTQYKVSYHNQSLFTESPNKIWRFLSLKIYHLYKSLYHEDKYHSSKEPFVNDLFDLSKRKIDIEKTENKHIQFYIDQVDKKLEKIIIDLNRKIDKKYSESFVDGDLIDFDFTGWTVMRNRINDNVGVITYLMTIIRSEPIRRKIGFHSDEVHFLLTKINQIFNLEFSRRVAKKSKQNDILTKIGHKLSRISIIIAVIVFILSTGMSIILSVSNTKDIKHINNSLINLEFNDSLNHCKIQALSDSSLKKLKHINENMETAHIYTKEEFISIYNRICSHNDSVIYIINSNNGMNTKWDEARDLSKN